MGGRRYLVGRRLLIGEVLARDLDLVRLETNEIRRQSFQAERHAPSLCDLVLEVTLPFLQAKEKVGQRHAGLREEVRFEHGSISSDELGLDRIRGLFRRIEERPHDPLDVSHNGFGNGAHDTRDKNGLHMSTLVERT